MNPGDAAHAAQAAPSVLPPLPEDERILLLLGLLTSQDRHGYEINDFIEHQLHCVIDLKKATAYQLLDRLEQHELISGRIEAQEMKPSRKVYALTPAGHAHFLTLLAAQLRAEEPLILPGNVPVMFYEHLTDQERLTALRERLEKLVKRMETYAFLLTKVPLTTGVGMAMGRIQALTQADFNWTQGLVRRLTQDAPQS